ncbi:hypothetical protein DFJ73DRAFT_564916 [Zopfochytrium polystomum]|nr:hypothetical protein DFJ73DRAFT_564916 [Zopfochytrium polystomum]
MWVVVLSITAAALVTTVIDAVGSSQLPSLDGVVNWHRAFGRPVGTTDAPSDDRRLFLLLCRRRRRFASVLLSFAAALVKCIIKFSSLPFPKTKKQSTIHLNLLRALSACHRGASPLSSPSSFSPSFGREADLDVQGGLGLAQALWISTLVLVVAPAAGGSAGGGIGMAAAAAAAGVRVWVGTAVFWWMGAF